MPVMQDKKQLIIDHSNLVYPGNGYRTNKILPLTFEVAEDQLSNEIKTESKSKQSLVGAILEMRSEKTCALLRSLDCIARDGESRHQVKGRCVYTNSSKFIAQG